MTASTFGFFSTLALSCLAAAPAGATEWRLVAGHPERYVGQAVDLDPAYCGGGGYQGDDAGLYICRVGDGRLFLETRRLAPTPAARTVRRECGGLDVWEQNPPCRFKVRLVPRAYRADPTIKGPVTTIVIRADTLDLH